MNTTTEFTPAHIDNICVEHDLSLNELQHEMICLIDLCEGDVVIYKNNICEVTASAYCEFEKELMVELESYEGELFLMKTTEAFNQTEVIRFIELGI